VFNQPEKARGYAQIVLNSDIGKTFNAYAHYVIGCSYLFTDYEKAKEHLYISSKIYMDINRKDAADNVNEERELLEIVWDKDIFQFIQIGITDTIGWLEPIDKYQMNLKI
jgi:hypothetical protein